MFRLFAATNLTDNEHLVPDLDTRLFVVQINSM